jgi:hypothetical protein
MQYLLLVYADENRWLNLPQAEKDRIWEECEAYGADLKKNGHFLAGAPLERSSTARTVRKVSGQTVVTDGPFAETKEVLAGYHLVECRDTGEAVALGAHFPGLRIGLTIEVRALMSD